MPSLPRIRRTRPRQYSEAAAARPEPRVAELSANGLTWIHLDPPVDPETVNALRERFGWHPLDVEDVLSKRQRPKVDDYLDDGYLFGVLHFPAYDKNVQRLNAGELDFFLGPDYLVTISNVELLPVTRLFNRVQEDERFREQLFSKGSGRLLYEVLDDLFDYCFPILDKIAYKLDSIEDDIEDRRSEEIVTDISKVKRFLPEELELYFDDLVDASERIWDLLDNYKEVVEALESTNESVISHRQNDVLRILTVFSVILLPLTLISGIFGMNVLFPGEHTHAAFWAIVGLMVTVIIGMIGFFKYKRWL
jgi:magnesium transporter